MKFYKSVCLILILISSVVFSFPLNVKAANGTWTQRITPDQPAERAYYGMVYDTVRDKTVMFGGLSRGSGNLNETWELSGTTWTKINTSNSPSPRYALSMAYDEARQQTVLFGGDFGPTAGQTWVYDGTNWVLKNPVNNPPSRYSPLMTYDKTRQVVVMYGGAGMSDTWEWDGTNWTEKVTANNPGARHDTLLAFDSNRNKVVAFGGFGADNSTWEYDGNDWTNVSPVVSPPASPYVTLAYDGSVQKTILFLYDEALVKLRVWTWDGTVWNEVTPVSGPEPKILAVAVYDSVRTKTIIFGGEFGTSEQSQQYKDTWAFDGTNNIWSQVVQLKNPPASAAPVVYDRARQQLVRFGGSTATAGSPSATNETWVLGDSDIVWTRKFPVNVPPSRLNHGLVYDENRQVVILFGGQFSGSGTNTNSTWEWNGTDWTERILNTSPPPMSGPYMAYDSDRQVIVLWGGADSVAFDNTWEYDGTDWQLRNTANRPPGNSSGAMAYDKVRQKTVLFGGYGNNFGETWEYNGNDWTHINPAQSPGGRGLHGMAFDESRNVMVIFGGVGPGYLNDTWEYDGTNWSQVSVTSSPGPRYSNSLIYNPNRQTVSIVAGGIPTGLIDDTWEYVGPPPPPNLLTALAPAKVWVGLKNSDAVGLKLDLKAEVYVGTTLAGTSEIYSVPGGSSGFNNAKLNTIPLVLSSGPLSVNTSNPLIFKFYLRNTCFGPTHNSGTARFWFNDSQANSRFGATVNSQASDYYMLDGFSLNTSVGAGPKQKIDVAAGAPCSPWKLVGTWVQP